LLRVGVRQIFTLSGNHIMPMSDACLKAGIGLVHTRHEAATVHMADAPIVAALDDGTFGFHASEMDTAVRYGVSFVVVVSNAMTPAEMRSISSRSANTVRIG
jgi:thiamine pyrophosphate-dependent acetolactate synthase large subunit-like protein